MKFLLIITVCSSVYNTCMPPAEMYPLYSSFTDCVMAGHENSLYVLKELGPKVQIIFIFFFISYGSEVPISNNKFSPTKSKC